MIITDGRGLGRSATVDADQRLYTSARITPAMAAYSDSIKHAYIVSTSLLVLPTSLINVFWIQNQSEHHVYIDKFWFFWNGGSTNFNRHAQVDFYASPNDAGEPTVNKTELISGEGLTNLAFANNAPNTKAFMWDGVGTEMTVPGDSTVYGHLGSILVPLNGFTMELGGSLILGTNNTILLKAAGLSEAGKLGVTTTFFRKV